MIVRERKEVITYIQSRGIEKIYLKAKKYLEQDLFYIVDFKKRLPKTENIFYFRINKKYRAIGHKIGDIFVVTEISDHQ